MLSKLQFTNVIEINSSYFIRNDRLQLKPHHTNQRHGTENRDYILSDDYERLQNS